jgi:hypothetical protein
MPTEAGSDADKIAELNAIVQAVRERVRARYPEPSSQAGGETANGTPDAIGAIRVQVADLMPIVHARDAAQAKTAAIGSVNPRAGGLVNSVIQTFKKTLARTLRWFVRDQVVFNREVVAGLESVIEALNEHNRTLVQLAGQVNERLAQLASETQNSVAPLKQEALHLRDLESHWNQWRVEWERRLETNEIQFLRSVADIQGAHQHRTTLMEANFRGIVQAQHED